MTKLAGTLSIKFRELHSLLFVILAFALVIVLSEAYLLHRTEQFFGGGALNRPFAVQSTSDAAIYFAHAFAYDFVFYATLSVMLTAIPLCQNRLNPMQRLLAIFYILSLTTSVAFFVRWQLYAYFNNKFDIGLMLDMIDRRPIYLLSFIGSAHLIICVLALGSMLLVLWFIRALKPFAFVIASWKPRRWTILPMVVVWAAIIASHLATVEYRELHFGWSKKLSYGSIHKILEIVIDFDGDGFSAFTRPRDPDWLSNAIHPFAVDYPNNQIDENLLAGDLPDIEWEAMSGGIRHITRSNGRNVLLIVVETFRIDVINKVTKGVEVMPFLSKLARDHAYTDHMYSNFGVTSRAVQSIMTGSLHYTEQSHTLADELRRLGYKTFVVSAQDESWGRTDEILRFREYDGVLDARDVDWAARDLTYVEKANKFARTLTAEEVNERVIGFIEDHRGEKWFMYVNYQDLHYPYFDDHMKLVLIDEGRTDAEFFARERREEIWRQYANAAHHLDAALGRLWRNLQEKGLDDRTVMVVVGDHPDSFYENGLLGHAWTVDEHQRRTPFLIINGLGTYTTPMGQEEVAEVVLNSVQQGSGRRRASFVVDNSKRIFGLTGVLEWPREIAWMWPGGLATYDFRVGRWQLNESGPWRAPSEVQQHSPDEYELFLALVRRWESEVVLKKLAE